MNRWSLLTLLGCARRGIVILESGEGRVIIESKGEGPYSRVTAPYYSSEVLKIPKGHMPPPGKCRNWYPDLPPSNDPLPVSAKIYSIMFLLVLG